MYTSLYWKQIVGEWYRYKDKHNFLSLLRNRPELGELRHEYVVCVNEL